MSSPANEKATYDELNARIDPILERTWKARSVLGERIAVEAERHPLPPAQPNHEAYRAAFASKRAALTPLYEEDDVLRATLEKELAAAYAAAGWSEEEHMAAVCRRIVGTAKGI